MKILNTLKMIVFDLDGTFYPYSYIIRSNYENALKFFCNKFSVSENEMIKKLCQNNIYPYVAEKNHSITAYASSIGINLAEWNSYRNDNFNINNIPNPGLETVTLASLENLSCKYSLILLSSNTRCIVSRIMKKLNVRSDLFLSILTSENFGSRAKPFNKAEAFTMLSKEYGITLTEMLSIGDRFSSDIKPMVELGGLGVVIKHPKDIDEICKDLENHEMRIDGINYAWYY